MKSIGVTSICPSKQTYGSNIRPSKPLVLIMLMQINLYVMVMFVQENL